jgi:hypothetical protein
MKAIKSHKSISANNALKEEITEAYIEDDEGKDPSYTDVFIKTLKKGKINLITQDKE